MKKKFRLMAVRYKIQSLITRVGRNIINLATFSISDDWRSFPVDHGNPEKEH